MHLRLLFASCALVLPAVQAAVLDRSSPNYCSPYKCILGWSGASAWCASQSKAHSTCTSTTTSIVQKTTCTTTATQVVTATATAPNAVTSTVQSTSTVTSTVVTTTTVAGVPTDSYATCTSRLSSPAKRAADPEPRDKRETEERRSLQPPSCLLGLPWLQCNQACQCAGCHGSGCGSTVTQTCTETKTATACATSTRVSTTTTTVSTTVTTTAVSTTTTVTTSTSTQVTAATPTNRFYIQAQLADDASGTSSGFLGITTGDNDPVGLEPFSASLQSWSLAGTVVTGAGSENSPANPSTMWIFAPESPSPIYTQGGFLLAPLTCSITNCILSCTGVNFDGTTSNTVYFDEAGDSIFIAGPTTNDAQAVTVTMHIITYGTLAGGS